MTAYSVAVGPSSLTRKDLTRETNAFIVFPFLLPCPLTRPGQRMHPCDRLRFRISAPDSTGRYTRPSQSDRLRKPRGAFPFKRRRPVADVAGRRQMPSGRHQCYICETLRGQANRAVKIARVNLGRRGNLQTGPCA
jgi:hypothetical protein